MRGRGVLAVGLAALALAVPPRGRAAGDAAAQRLVTAPGSSAMPAWSPDGSRLVFHARRRDDKQDGVATRKIWSVAADGAGARRLTNGTKDEYHPALSPDGRRLLFVSELNGSRDIWLADADGRNPVPLTDDPGTEDQPAWAPDSRRIAFAAVPDQGGSFDLWLVNADGSGRRRLTATPANEIFPAWHPGGERIAYVTDAGGNLDIHAIDVAVEGALGAGEGRTTPLVATPDQEARPAWSPEGRWLAFSRWPARGRSTEATLWVAAADGSAPLELSEAPVPATHPAWAPDGRRLAFQHRTAAGWEIWTLALPATLTRQDGRGPRDRARGGGAADTATLRRGDTLSGTLEATRLRVRTAYGALELPRTALAAIHFGTGERGLARILLANGDTMTGFLDADELRLRVGARTERLAVARLAELRLAATGPPAAAGRFRAVMRNGDSLLVTRALGPLRLRVGGRVLDVEPGEIDHVEFAESGERATVALSGGDRLDGELAAERLELELAVGPRLAVHASSIRTLVRTAGRG